MLCRNLPSQVFSVRGLRLYFPILEPLVALSVWLPSCSSQCIRMWECLVHQLLPATSPLCLTSWLCLSYRSDECFFFNSLVVRFSDSSGCFFTFKFVVVLLLVVWGGTVPTYSSILARRRIIAFEQLLHHSKRDTSS